MIRKTLARNAGSSGRVNISGPELEMLEAGISNQVELDIVDAKEISHALIDSKDTDRFLIVTPA